MTKNCKRCNKEFSKPVNCSLKEWAVKRKFCSHKCFTNARLGTKLPSSWIENLTKSSWNRGKPLSKKHREGIGSANSGDKSVMWKGGVTKENERLRHSMLTKDWRASVFKRDGYTCQVCTGRGGKLHSHHKLNFSTHPELRFEVENGITLCEECHLMFHKTFGKTGNTPEQVDLFKVEYVYA